MENHTSCALLFDAIRFGPAPGCWIAARTPMKAPATTAAVVSPATIPFPTRRRRARRRTVCGTPGSIRTSSALLRAEVPRAVRPYGPAAVDLAKRMAGRGELIRLSSVLLDLSVSLGRPDIRTLDAIHLATAEALGDPPALVTIITRDLRVHHNATALGHPVE